MLIARRLVGMVVERVVAESGTGFGSRVEKNDKEMRKKEKRIKKDKKRQNTLEKTASGNVAYRDAVTGRSRVRKGDGNDAIVPQPSTTTMEKSKRARKRGVRCERRAKIKL